MAYQDLSDFELDPMWWTTDFEPTNTVTSIPEEDSLALADLEDHYHSLGRDEPDPKRPRISYDCTICGTTYTERRTLLRHQRTPAHCRKAGLPVQSHQCALCAKTCTREDQLLRHVKEVHLGQRRVGTKAKEIQSSGNDLNGQGVGDAAHEETLPNDDVAIALNESESRAPANPTATSAVTTSSSITRPEHGATGSREIIYNEAEPEPDKENKSDDVPELDTTSSDTASISSVSTTASRLSFSSLKLPFRIRPGTKPSRNPRPNKLKTVVPCPLCKKEFGTTEEEVRQHIDQHFGELSAETASNQCETCQVTFVHQRDLRWHLGSAVATQECGFNHAHVNPCTGHHPPGDASYGEPPA